MKCVILQPSYIPWRGYFHQIALADVFVFYDDVQYDARGWRNRNKIKTPSGSRWITIPVHSKGSQIDRIPINQIYIDWTKSWNEEHWSSLKHNYTKAPCFPQFTETLHDFYTRKPEKLIDFTIPLTKLISDLLGFHPTFLLSSQLQAEGSKTDRLISILKIIGADHYISGPSAREYIDPNQFREAGISLEYMQYNYPDYPQLYPPFDGQVSILDLLFMTGSNARDYIIGK
jgi:hypothetical protein